MNFVQRLIRADHLRKTRFHTARGEACLSPVAISRAAVSTLNRVMFERYESVPWLVRAATRELEPALVNADVFEFGSGMSTLWYSKRARSVVSVESNRQWFEKTKKNTAKIRNCNLVLQDEVEYYPLEIRNYLDRYDIIIVDGIQREACVKAAVSMLRVGGLLVLDNTDVERNLIPLAEDLGEFSVRRHSGYAPGIFHANETSILTRLS